MRSPSTGDGVGTTPGVKEPVKPDFSDPRAAPFKYYVEAKRAGIPVHLYPLPPGAAARFETERRVRRLRPIFILLVFVVSGISYLLSSPRTSPTVGQRVPPVNAASPGGAPSNAAGTDPAAASSVTGVAAPAAAGAEGNAASSIASAGTAAGTESAVQKVKPFLKASQYTDPGDGLPLEGWVKGELRRGDYLTVIPSARGWEFLYFVVYGPNDQFRLSRIYPAEMLRSAATPIKFTVKEPQSGLYQVMLIGSMVEIEKIQYMLQDANQLQGPTDRLRALRMEKLVSELKAGLPEGRWEHRSLEPVPYRL